MSADGHLSMSVNSPPCNSDEQHKFPCQLTSCELWHTFHLAPMIAPRSEEGGGVQGMFILICAAS